MAAQSPRGLAALRFLDSDDTASLLRVLRQRFEVIEDDAVALEIGTEIERLMQGDSDAISARAVDLSLVESDFQRRALMRLRRVPAGSVISYQGLAAALGVPSGQRAIGNTVATNPVPIYVPCHRVIRSDGSIGNYGGGPERKLKLLRAEGFGVSRQRRVPSEAVYGHWGSRIFCRPTCSSVRRTERRQWLIFADPERARRFGMRACKLCHPA
jgi:O-6-methylguanine DNA methyltransferase